jgi:NTP pyrophosphatase (non-canonical NTP hydrolase)
MGEVGTECADVIFAAMMVAKDFDIDIALELSRKKEKIEHRFNL